MRRKDNKVSFGVTDGLDFSSDSADYDDPIDNVHRNGLTNSVDLDTSTVSDIPVSNTEIDPNRNYSIYYNPRPKLGSKGKPLGRGAVKESERKIQFSVTCTPAQKEAYKEAAKKDRRKLPDFICMAIEEYIENHNLK